MIIPIKCIPYDEIEEQIKARLEMRRQMVGWLYPSILSDEIDELRRRFQKGNREGETK